MSSTQPTFQARRLAALLHEVYEARSVAEGWTTQESCCVPFDDLPAANQRVMLEVAECALRECSPMYVFECELADLRRRVEVLEGAP